MSDSSQTPNYPSEEEITRWLEEHYGSQDYGKPMKSDIGIVRAACDWQREQDALMLQREAERGEWHPYTRSGLLHAVEFLRSGDSHD